MFHPGVCKLTKLAAIERIRQESLFSTTGSSHFQRSFLFVCAFILYSSGAILPPFKNNLSVPASTMTFFLLRASTPSMVFSPTTAYAVCSKQKTTALSTMSCLPSASLAAAASTQCLLASFPPFSPGPQTISSQ